MSNIIFINGNVVNLMPIRLMVGTTHLRFNFGNLRLNKNGRTVSLNRIPRGKGLSHTSVNNLNKKRTVPARHHVNFKHVSHHRCHRHSTRTMARRHCLKTTDLRILRHTPSVLNNNVPRIRINRRVLNFNNFRHRLTTVRIKRRRPVTLIYRTINRTLGLIV